MIPRRLPLLAVAGLACAAGAGPEERIAAMVSREAALANVRELVAYGPRTGGTGSGDRAAAAVAAKMRAMGLQVETIEDPPDRVHEERAWTVTLEGRSLSSAWPYGFSPSLARTTAPVRLEEETGIPEAARPAAGAILLTGRPGGEAAPRAAGAGAIALLTDTPGDPNRYQDWAPIGSLASRGGAAGAIPVFGLSYNDGRLVRAAIDRTRREGGAEPRVTVALESSLHEGRPRTVSGTLEGAGGDTRLILVCAHGDSDSGGPGADDNASGVATALEVARALAGARDAGLLPARRPEVRFLVWGAEYHSTRAWASSRPADLARLAAVINFDETGTGAERDAVYYEGSDVPFNEKLLRTIEAVADDHAGRDGFPAAYTSVPSMGGTDAYVFMPREHQGLGLAGREIPTTTVFTAAWDKPARLKRPDGWISRGWREPGEIFVDYSAYYHSSGDTPANTTEREPDNMTRCARLVALAIYRLMSAGA